jgi:hypothetical protein
MIQNYGAHVTWIFWRGIRRNLWPRGIEHNGSAFILDCGRGPFVVTAGHIYRKFLNDQGVSRHIKSQIGNLAVDLGERLIDCGIDARIDIATFRLQPDEIPAIGKRVVIGSEISWPAAPNASEAVFFGGFLGSQRRRIGPKEVSFGLHCAMTPVSDCTMHQIYCRLDRRSWVDPAGHGLPLPGARGNNRCRAKALCDRKSPNGLR